MSINERDLGGNIIVNAIDAFIKRSAWCPSHLLRQVIIYLRVYSPLYRYTIHELIYLVILSTYTELY